MNMFDPTFSPYALLRVLAIATAACSFAAAQAQAPQRDLGVVDLRPTGQSQASRLYGESHALVIGASRYTAGWSDLSGVRGDVEAVAQLLRGQGFKVQTLLDPTRATLDAGLRRFAVTQGANPNNRLLVYFAGHGHTLPSSVGKKLGYIVPVDAPRPDRDMAGFRELAYSMENFEVLSRQIEAKHVLFVFDSCFSGTVFKARSDVPDAISEFTEKPVRLFITAGDETQKVPDESVFRRVLERALGPESAADLNKDGFITGTELGSYLHEQVTNYSRRSQTPRWGKLSDPDLDRGDFVFVSARANTVATGMSARDWSAYANAIDGLSVLKQRLNRTSIERIQQEAEAGDVEAQYLVAIAMSNGLGVPKDEAGARRLMRVAARGGFPRASMAYGNYLFWGEGGPKSEDEALEWWMDGAKNDFAPSIAKLARYYAWWASPDKRDYSLSFRFATQAAALGNPEGLMLLGEHYRLGLGRPADKSKALTLFREAADKGSADALSSLSYAYRYGAGAAVDKLKAFKFLLQCGDRGLPSCFTEAGDMIEYKEIETVEFPDAGKYYIKAADAGDSKGLDLALAMVFKGRLTKPAGWNLESKTSEALAGNQGESTKLLIRAIQDGTSGFAKDPRKAGILNRSALARAQAAPPDSELAYPGIAHHFAQNLIDAIKSGVLPPASQYELTDLESTWGSTRDTFKYQTSIDCGGVVVPFNLFVWNRKTGDEPVSTQVSWVKNARGCTVDTGVPESFAKIYKSAREANVEYIALVKRALEKGNAR